MTTVHSAKSAHRLRSAEFASPAPSWNNQPLPDQSNVPRQEAEVSEKSSEKSENHEVVFMTAATEASHLIRMAVEPRGADESVKALIVRAARRVGIGFERAKAIWYREARVIRAEEMDRLREIAARRQSAQEAAAHELSELNNRISRLEAMFAAGDEDFGRPQIDAMRAAYREMAGGGGGVHRP